MSFSDNNGRIAVETARSVAEGETEGRYVEPDLPSAFDGNRGVFVTIKHHPSGDLRGCIGYIQPIMPLSEALSAAARAVCHDPRFPSLKRKETANCVFEVTVLSEPVEILYSGPEDLLSKIEIGRDGLIVQRDSGMFTFPTSAVFLPQVPVEQGWDKETYVSELCLKAGMRSDAWIKENLRFFVFRGDVFGEKKPNGCVERISVHALRDRHSRQGVCQRDNSLR